MQKGKYQNLPRIPKYAPNTTVSYKNDANAMLQILTTVMMILASLWDTTPHVDCYDDLWSAQHPFL